MARIRTIKPEFFTSDDICSLSMAARLLYIGVWCEADREGRLEWRPRNLKRRYLPDDSVDIDALCAELIDSGLIVLYGNGLAYIPTFAKHQHVNPREASSSLPAPETTRQARVDDASGTRDTRDSDAQVGREGKGKEGELRVDATRPRSPTGSRLPDEWQPREEDRDWARQERPDVDLRTETAAFRDYWTAKPGKDGVKLDWSATWRNWIRKANGPPRGAARPQPAAPMPTLRLT